MRDNITYLGFSWHSEPSASLNPAWLSIIDPLPSQRGHEAWLSNDITLSRATRMLVICYHGKTYPALPDTKCHDDTLTRGLLHMPSTPDSPGSTFAASIFAECLLPAAILSPGKTLTPNWLISVCLCSGMLVCLDNFSCIYIWEGLYLYINNPMGSHEPFIMGPGTH